MIFFLINFLVVFVGFFIFRKYSILLLLSLESLVLFFHLSLILFFSLELHFFFFSITLLSIAVMAATIGLTLSSLKSRFWNKTEMQTSEGLLWSF